MSRGNPNRILFKAKKAKGIAANTLVVARALADQDGLTFRSDGTCMYPTIRPGDVLRIRPCSAVEVQVGDIAVIRKSQHLLSHRVVSKGMDREQSFIVTRPDRVRQGADSPTFDEDLLGVVASVERRGRVVPLERAELAWPARLYFFFHLRQIAVRSMLRSWWSITLPRFQETPFYRRLAGWWLRLARPSMRYTVRVPMPALGDAVFRRMEVDDFNVEKDWRGRPVKRFVLTLHLNGASEPAASMAFERHEDNGWTLDGCQVQARYRGAGLEHCLLSRAGEMLPPGSIHNA